jgi:CRP-like cAMP-binding protein
MQTDHRPRVSIPLAHDHFGSGARRPNNEASPTELSQSVDALTLLRRATGATLRRVSHVARQALKMGKNLTTQTIAAARWSGEQSSWLATKLKTRIVRNTATPTAVADRFGEPSQYASLPNRLSALATLSAEQHALIRSSLPGRRTHQTGSTLLAEGEQTPNPTFILSGWAARTRVQDGKLHVLGILLPGDGVCLFGPPCTQATTTLIALTTVETAEAGPIMEMVGEAEIDSPVRLAMHRAMAEDEAFLLNQTMRLMMKPATARLAHLLLELRYRLARVGLATNNAMPFALDRRMLAAALGLSPRAVGVVVRTLEQRKIARFGHNRLVILREDVLRKLAGFKPPAFSEKPGRRLISDIEASDMTLQHAPWIDAPELRASRFSGASQRPS